MGNCLCDQGRYEEALEAYRAALDQPDADVVSLAFNKATTLWRAGRLDEAEEIVAALTALSEPADTPDELRIMLHGLRLGLLIDRDRPEALIAYHEQHAGELPAREDFQDDWALVDERVAAAKWMVRR